MSAHDGSAMPCISMHVAISKQSKMAVAPGMHWLGLTLTLQMLVPS
jgi:hypothetical protein